MHCVSVIGGNFGAGDYGGFTEYYLQPDLPELLDLVLSGRIDPAGKVFDLTLALAEVAEGYRAMDERRAIKVLLEP